MARSRNKAAVVLCMDVGFSMSNSFPGEESAFEQAKKVMTMFLQRQVFAESKDEIALVLFGTDGTNNTLADEDQYQNITVHRHLMLPDFDLLEDVESKIQPGSQQSDFLDALIVSMDLIQRETAGKKFEKRHIEMFTDLSSPFSKEHLDIIIHHLKKSEISLQFFLPFPVDKEDGTGDRGDGKLRSDHHGPSFPQKGLTEQQKEGVQMVKNLMMSLEGKDGLDEIYSFSESLRQLCVFKKIQRNSVPWPCQLTIGSNLAIKIVAYKSILQERVTKAWTIVDARTLKKEDIQRETVYCLNDDDETEVSKEDTIQGYRYGSDIVPFSKVDEEQMKYKSEGKCFSVLGFCKSSEVPINLFTGYQIVKVFAARDDEPAAVAFSSLVHALDELDMVAIIRYAYHNKSNPQVGMAFPHIKDTYECLMYVQLPFMEDLRQYMFSSFRNSKKYIPTEAQLSAVDALIDSMSLVKKNEEEDTVEDLFLTTKIPNPQFQRLFQCLLYRAFHPQEPLPPIPQHIVTMLDPPAEVTAKCQDSLSKIKTLFPLTEAVKTKDQVTAQDIFQDNHEEGPTAKKCKTEEGETPFSVSSLAEGNVTRVGSVNPAENFRVLVRQKNATFEEASRQLIAHIEQFLDTNETPYFMKSMDCIKAFREEAIQFSEEQCFNSFLKGLREKVDVKQLNHFWEIVVQDGITLITKDEASGSSVTAEEAKKFLAPKEKPDGNAAAAFEEGGDVDDLLDMM
ncbi:X-ray repair cross-complementing protein 5 [Tupaia chinensis]|uniref:X-ray repair cross-complementing protein 5 n=1 Tax=Tupaia chinensis TaxID=246437 RepID=UPI000FFB4951|nr:X-ray repair cross-complementing protein 5 [Tupaia chinensis]